MSVLQEIEDKSLKYVESGFECPDFVFLSPDLYSQLLREMNQHMYTHPPSPSSGIRTLTMYTSCAILKVQVCSAWPNDSIIIGDHPILMVLQKLEGII